MAKRERARRAVSSESSQHRNPGGSPAQVRLYVYTRPIHSCVDILKESS